MSSLLRRRTGCCAPEREGASGHAVELFASMLAEIRAYGEGIIVAEQIPAKLVPDVVEEHRAQGPAPAARRTTTARSSAPP